MTRSEPKTAAERRGGKGGRPDRGDMGKHFAVAAAVFAAVVMLTGGASRGDVPQLAILYPASILMAAYALVKSGVAGFSTLKVAIVLVAAYLLWALVQLFPLPPAIWSALPERQVIADLDGLVGLGDVWRPITFAPDRTISAVLGLFTPLAALLLAASIPVRDRQRLLRRILLCAIAANAVLGLVHAILGGDALHLFTISNDDRPVGFFANVNHSVVFSAIGIVLWAMETGSSGNEGRRRARGGAPVWNIIATGMVLLCFIHILIGGSRAGLIVAVPAVLAAIFLFLSGRANNRSKSGKRAHGVMNAALDTVFKYRLAILLAVPAAMAAAFFVFAEIPAISRLYDKSLADNVRWTLYDPLLDMVSSFWLLGAGLGSFEDVYYMFEPAALLAPFYVNQAHNDWLQIVIEGGLPAASLVIAGLALFVQRIIAVFREGGDGAGRAVAWIAVLVILSFASLVDYPLRTPVFQTMAVWLFVMLDSAAFSNRLHPRDVAEG